MITTNIYYRVFQIKIGESLGTCFTIDVNKKQYVVTAKHVVDKWDEKENIQIFCNGKWENLEMSLLGHCDGEIDISVLVASCQLSPGFEAPPTNDGMVWGQDVYFLGFPYGWSGDIGDKNRNYPMPFVKKAVVSCMRSQGDGVDQIYLDGHNNPGFSGGPFVFKEPNSGLFKFGGVISGYRYSSEPIYSGKEQLPLAYKYNTGIIVTYGIRHAVDLIESNPIGYSIKKNA